MKKWYVFQRMAEGRALFFVELNDDEFQTVCNFLCCQRNGPDEGYSGLIEPITHEGFNTKEDAEMYIRRHNMWPY